ncbi:MAG: 2-oxo acid dehydrogenase subunit E2, partial [Alicyclobacillaceae bacterium]|nr:2-oxo acid dehydrogenase subunit E2 [Alicyclobacillaceae bacterium]
MVTEIVMPKLGMAMENGTVVAWLKQVGEPVEKGEVVVQVQSEKIEYDVESPASGVLIDIVVPEGGTVPYGTVIGYIGEIDEIPPSKT